MKHGFFRELKRRHVYRVAVAYAVVGWLVIQAAATVSPYLHLPDTLTTMVIVVVALGFPVAVILAWAFEMTPDGVRRTVTSDAPEARAPEHDRRIGQTLNIIIIGVLVVAVALMAWRVWAPHTKASKPSPIAATTSPRAPATASSPAVAASAIPAKSIAVLPFENLSTDKANAYFADGMQDLILTKLADIGALKVVSRTSTMQYGSHPENLTKIGQALGVATVLEGSVQKAGDQVLINVQLIDTRTDSHIWADSYTRTLDNIFGVEGEVADKIAGALNAKLTASESAAVARVPTRNKQAYQAYLKAIYFLDDYNRTLDAGELQTSIDLAKQAVAADPDFVAAWNLLSLGYQKLGGNPRAAENAVVHALKLDPDNAKAHGLYAFTLAASGQYVQAIAQAKEGVRLSHGHSSIAHYALAFVYETAGHYDQAIPEIERAVQLAPQVNFIRMGLGGAQTSLRRYRSARVSLRYVVDRDPADVAAAGGLANVDVMGFGDIDGARKVLQGVPTPVASSGALADAWYSLDMLARDYPAALAVIRQAPASWFKQNHLPLALYEARVYRAQGKADQARQAFTQARAMLEGDIKQAPADAGLLARLHARLALALAGLGDGKAAEGQAQRAMMRNQQSHDDSDVSNANAVVLDVAMAHAWTGHTAAAIKLLHSLLQKPAGDVVSVALLKLDPSWDPIRKTPAFQALLKKFAVSSPSSAPVAKD